MLLEVIHLGAVCDEDNTLITEAIESCVQKYDLSVQQIEAHLRFRQCRVFIIAQKPPSGEMYEILVSTKYGMELLKDLTKLSKNYSENFDKLAYITFSNLINHINMHFKGLWRLTNLETCRQLLVKLWRA